MLWYAVIFVHILGTSAYWIPNKYFVLEDQCKQYITQEMDDWHTVFTEYGINLQSGGYGVCVQALDLMEH
jgi:hypothetical protein